MVASSLALTARAGYLKGGETGCRLSWLSAAG